MPENEVFISYKAEEIKEAEWVKERLEKEGIACWMAPASIPGGSSYAVQIPKAIRECRAFVLILSKNAQESRWVPRELDQAINAGKVILPFMIENCPLRDDFGFYLSNVQRYDAWQDRERAFQAMLRVIRSLVGEKRPENPFAQQNSANVQPNPFAQQNSENVSANPMLPQNGEIVPANPFASQNGEIMPATPASPKSESRFEVLPTGEVRLKEEHREPVHDAYQQINHAVVDEILEPSGKNGKKSRKTKKSGRSGNIPPTAVNDGMNGSAGKSGKKKSKVGRIFLILAAALLIVIAAVAIVKRANRIVIAGKEFSKKDHSVYLSGVMLDQTDMAQFRKFKELHNITVTKSTFTSASLSPMLVESLTSLDLSGCSIDGTRALSLDFSKTPNLSSINVSDNAGFTSAGQFEVLAGKLNSLRISRTGIKDLTPLSSFEKLRYLYASGNGISDISALSAMKILSEVYLGDNRITSVSVLQNCPDLRTLDISNNPLTGLEGLETCINMEKLFADNTGISSLEPLTNMTVLRQVSISGNAVDDISILEKSAKTLTSFYAANNQIEDIFALKTAKLLNAIDVSGNKLTTLAPLERAEDLEKLIASGNNITTLDGVMKHPKLVLLDLSDNAISGPCALESQYWPKDKQMDLDISNNEISSLSLDNTTKFHNLDIHGNPLEEGFETLYSGHGYTLTLDYNEDINFKKLSDAAYTYYNILDVPLDKQVAIKDVMKAYGTFYTTEEYENEKASN